MRVAERGPDVGRDGGGPDVSPGRAERRPSALSLRWSQPRWLSSSELVLQWLVRLRWHAFGGQALAVVLVGKVLGARLPLVPLLGLIAVTGLTNVALARGLRHRADRAGPGLVLAVLLLDCGLLTALLSFSGGPANPFASLYLVHVSLAALVLAPRWVVLVVLLSIAGYASLFAWHVPLDWGGHGPAEGVHLHGTWVAFTLTAASIAYFVMRVAGVLRERDASLARAQRHAAHADKLGALGHLAAGAAHELSTPLATIAVAAKELEHRVQRRPERALEDARLIREEVERCRAILQRMSASAGLMVGEVPDTTTAGAILEAVRRQVPRASEAALRLRVLQDASFVCPVHGLVQALANLVRNALQASEARGTPVSVSAEVDRTHVRFVVEDEGGGIPEEVLRRIGEPFLSTKAPGEGMGLGLFLSQGFAERCQGRLGFATEGKGTRATLELPRLIEEGAA